MQNTQEQKLLTAILDSWDRNNTIVVNLLRAIPAAGLHARAVESSPSVSEMFGHIHYVRLVFLSEDAPEFSTKVPENEWVADPDIDRIAGMLNDSALAVREAVAGKVTSGGEMDLHYDHPILFLEHMIWHEGYHQGQIKLALKLCGHAISDQDAGPLTWGVWMRKKGPGYGI
jgi:uncharacterized damage-inducible protein DinB